MRMGNVGFEMGENFSLVTQSKQCQPNILIVMIADFS